MFIARTGVGRVGFDDPMEIVEWQPPGADGRGRCRLEKRGPVMLGWAELTVEPHGSGSRVTWREAGRAGPAAGVHRPGVGRGRAAAVRPRAARAAAGLSLGGGAAAAGGERACGRRPSAVGCRLSTPGVPLGTFALLNAAERPTGSSRAIALLNGTERSTALSRAKEVDGLPRRVERRGPRRRPAAPPTSRAADQPRRRPAAPRRADDPQPASTARVWVTSSAICVISASTLSNFSMPRSRSTNSMPSVGAVEVAGEVQDVRLDPALADLEGRVGADGDRGVAQRRRRDGAAPLVEAHDPAGVHAVGRERPPTRRCAGSPSGSRARARAGRRARRRRRPGAGGPAPARPWPRRRPARRSGRRWR